MSGRGPTIYAPGGPNAVAPHRNVLVDFDDDARLVHDYTSGDTVRPYTSAENAFADARAAMLAQQATASDDRATGLRLLDQLAADIGPSLTGAHAGDVWPTVQTWRTLNLVKRADVTTLAALAQIVVWMVPACLRTARAARKALRIAAQITTTDTDA